MKQILIQLDEKTYRKLRQRSFQQERSICSLVREMIAKTLVGDNHQQRPKRVNQFASVAVGRSRQSRLSPISERHDEVLAGIFK